MKIFLAGTSVLYKYMEELYNSPYILESFYSVQDWQMPIFKNCKMFLLDSGAFTFMNNYKGGTVNWDDYIERYAEFINKNCVKYFFELDIDKLVGIKEVERLRYRLENLTGRQTIPVWHKSRGIDYFKGMCDEYSYVSIGGIVVKEIKRGEYKNFGPMVEYARERHCHVHGLGFTPTKELRKYHFYSVDSTNWLTGGKFGTLYAFNGRYIESIRLHHRRSKWKEINIHNLREWIKLQQYADLYL